MEVLAEGNHSQTGAALGCRSVVQKLLVVIEVRVVAGKQEYALLELLVNAVRYAVELWK